MSGGSLGYFYSDLEEHKDDLGDIELNDLVKDISELFYAREWYLSGDTCEGDWVEARNKFKQKWFSESSQADRIRGYMDKIRKEVLDTFGISEDYCKNCSHWTKEEEKDSPYGWCEYHEGCMMHRSESCEKFEKRSDKK